MYQKWDLRTDIFKRICTIYFRRQKERKWSFGCILHERRGKKNRESFNRKSSNNASRLVLTIRPIGQLQSTGCALSVLLFRGTAGYYYWLLSPALISVVCEYLSIDPLSRRDRNNRDLISTYSTFRGYTRRFAIEKTSTVRMALCSF